MSDTRRVRVAARVLDFLSGTHVWQNPDALDEHGYGEGGQSVMKKLQQRLRDGNGGVTVDVTVAEAEVLLSYADTIIDANFDEPDHNELRAARKLLGELDKLIDQHGSSRVSEWTWREQA